MGLNREGVCSTPEEGGLQHSEGGREILQAALRRAQAAQEAPQCLAASDCNPLALDHPSHHAPPPQQARGWWGSWGARTLPCSLEQATLRLAVCYGEEGRVSQPGPQIFMT